MITRRASGAHQSRGLLKNNNKIVTTPNAGNGESGSLGDSVGTVTRAVARRTLGPCSTRQEKGASRGDAHRGGGTSGARCRVGDASSKSYTRRPRDGEARERGGDRRGRRRGEGGGEREVEASRRRPRGDGTTPRPDRGHGQRPVVAQIYLGTTLPRTEAHARAHTLRMHVL